MQQTTLRAVLFDVDGTLYHARPMRVRMALQLLALPLRAPLRASTTLKHIRAYRRALEQIRHDPRSDAPLARRHLESAAALAGATPDEVQTTIREWFEVRALRHLAKSRRDGVATLLHRLRELDIRIGFFSDYPVEDKLEALGLGEFADLCLCATDAAINAFKPWPDGFRFACGVWQLEPGEVLYVGDRPEVDAVGAAAAGMPCVILGRDTSSEQQEGFFRAADFAELRHFVEERV